MNSSEYSQQAALFYNRLVKRYKHLKKYARRLNLFAYRLYDRDIPEIPVAVDLYIEDTTGVLFAVLTEYERQVYRHEDKNVASLSELAEALCTALQIPSEQVYEKCRKRQRGEAQYEKIADSGKRIIVREGKCRFFVNISDYLDTGLFLDHRPARLAVADSAAGKSVLNLFCYTASFSIHALVNGARRVCSVDLSKNYLQWAAENAQLNGVADSERCRFVQSDVRLFLEQAAKRKERWDIIICDPPTFSNSKRAPQFFDVNRHWQDLIRSCCQVLAAEGILYFSTNSRTLRFDTAELSDRPDRSMGEDKFIYNNTLFTVQDISAQSIPEDFRNKKIHRLWKISHSTPF
ncbi:MULTISPECIES: class I SAM-dependent methyltransferase [unclassified Treponema]|uniref:class I SAM-dependent methyltransferase n=1 Tax=unclassified Treponema TaxID=2638727 RepID=UPI0005300E3B|nr:MULTISPECIES: class I SAM-dependent methyltransferase [unclassified Treponema]AIW88428.1 rRNA (guanine-N2)-methyltransferase [Treponema sp. OMZ 838]UTC51558.1 class I SAM-dependent methyltransferase [Treponema sp. OMZ 855]